MKINARQRKLAILGDTGCFLLAMVEAAQDRLGEYIDALLVYLQALECRFIKDTSLVLEHRRLMEMITGDRWEYRKEYSDYPRQPGEYIIEEWRRKAVGVTYTHFMYVRDGVEYVDTLGDSRTHAEGELVSKRVFRLLPK